MSYYLRVIDRKDNTDICSIHSTLSDAIDALSKVEIGTFVSLTTKIPRINKCLSCVTRKAHDRLLDENIQLREALEKYAKGKNYIGVSSDGTPFEFEENSEGLDEMPIGWLAQKALKGGK